MRIRFKSVFIVLIILSFTPNVYSYVEIGDREFENVTGFNVNTLSGKHITGMFIKASYTKDPFGPLTNVHNIFLIGNGNIEINISATSISFLGFKYKTEWNVSITHNETFDQFFSGTISINDFYFPGEIEFFFRFQSACIPLTVTISVKDRDLGFVECSKEIYSFNDTALIETNRFFYENLSMTSEFQIKEVKLEILSDADIRFLELFDIGINPSVSGQSIIDHVLNIPKYFINFLSLLFTILANLVIIFTEIIFNFWVYILFIEVLISVYAYQITEFEGPTAWIIVWGKLHTSVFGFFRELLYKLMDLMSRLLSHIPGL